MTTNIKNTFSLVKWWATLSQDNKLLVVVLSIAIGAVVWAKTKDDATTKSDYDKIRLFEERALRAEAKLDSCHNNNKLLEREFRDYIKQDRYKTESIIKNLDSLN